QPDVQQVFMEDYALEVHYTSGIVSDLVLEYTDPTGRAYFRGGGAGQGSKLEPFTSGEISLKAAQDKIIENKKVLIFIPFDLQFHYNKSEVEKKIKAFPLDLDVTVVTGTDADLDVVRTFNQYGLIVLNTHGQPDGFEVRTDAPLFSSARIIDTTVVVPASLVEQQALAAGISLVDIENGAIKLNAKVTMESDTNKVPLGFNYFYSIQVTDKFIRKLPRLNDAVVFGNYCFSGYTADGPSTRNIPEAFKSVGAITYYGYALDNKYSTPVDDKTSQDIEDAVYKRLLMDIDSTGKAHLKEDGSEWEDPNSHLNNKSQGGERIEITRAVMLTEVKEKRQTAENVKLKHFIDPDYRYDSPCLLMTDDRDDETYKLVCIGGQTWFAENLRYNASGSRTPQSGSVSTSGRLYNYNTVSDGGAMGSTGKPVRGICPEKWHIPTAEDWRTLLVFAGAKIDTEYDSEWIIVGPENLKGSARLVSKNQLDAGSSYKNDTTVNNTGFSAKSIGFGQEVNGTFTYKNDYIAYYWSSTSLGKFYDQSSMSWKYRNDWRHAVRFDGIPSFGRQNFDPQSITYYYPCRCVKD
ncbi:MAG: hypothetical protein KDC76_14295, partial [Bacteroidetes bacterium]|nr:hypothetical protein [Bacteroidota bacterium]